MPVMQILEYFFVKLSILYIKRFNEYLDIGGYQDKI